MKTAKIRNLILGEGMPKICVPIVEKTKESILQAAEAAMKTDMDILEWRGDWYADIKRPECLVETARELRGILGEIPLLFTIRTAEEGGELALTGDAYAKLLVCAAKSGCVDAVDVEAIRNKKQAQALIEVLHTYGVTVIASNHDFQKTPSPLEINSRLLAMFQLGADVAKIAVMPQSEQDVWNLMAAGHEAAEKGSGPVITMSMGQRGVISRLSGEHTGSALTFGAVGKVSAPGQIPVQALKNILTLIHEKQKNLFLIGFMGCGKSTLAEYLERLLGVSRMEMDQQLVEQEGKSIADIFAREGEAYFRKKETELLESFSHRQGMVVSCGGGVPLREENIEIMKKNGIVVFLDVTAQLVYDRVKDNTDRPLLNGHMHVDYISELMEKRRPWYEKAADVHIKIQSQSALEICAALLQMIENQGFLRVS